jgi:hypothetical protein
MKNEDLTKAIAATAPVNFRLSNKQGQTVLYTRLQQQDMTLELHNTSRSQLTIAASQSTPTKSPIDTDWHFQLQFRSGTLWESGEIKLDEKDQARWLLTSAGAGESASERAGDVILYLQYIGATPLQLDPGERVSISMQNIAVDGRAGSHGTRVELKYQRLQFAGNTQSLSGTCMHYLSVLDESPANEPGTAPILVDWAGPNTFLNDGTETTRILRLYNQSGQNLVLDGSSRITISLPVGGDSAEWALVQQADQTPVVFEKLTNWKKANDRKQLVGDPGWVHIELETNSLSLGSRHKIDIPITLKTTCPSGPAFIKVHYEGFAHLQGTRYVGVEKTPLVISPTFADESSITPGQLHVGKQALVVDDAGNVGIGVSPSGDARLEVEGSVKILGAGSVNPEGDGVFLKLDSPSGYPDFHMKSTDKEVSIGNKSHHKVMLFSSENFVTLLPNGNFGISQKEPSARLDVWGTAKISGNVGIGKSPSSDVKLDVEGALNVSGKACIKGALTTEGNVGIGCTTTTWPLEVAGGYAMINGLRISGADTGNTIYQNTGNFGITTNNKRQTITLGSHHHGAALTVKDNNVGIGTKEPTRGKLHVTGIPPSVNYNIGGVLRRQSPVVVDYTNTDTVQTVSIWGDSLIVGGEFHAVSDARIKNIQGRSDGTVDLTTLNRIEITDYTYKDVIANGHKLHKKVIGQQVEKVYPQAVSKHSDLVPNIYEKATVKDGWVELATDLAVGERVRLIGEKQEGIHEVLEVRDGAFRTAFQPVKEEVFVYGREVDDFRVVDYDAIAMLNVSATQELARKLEAKESEIAEMKKQLAEQGARLARMKQFEARLTRLENARSESL